MALKSIYLLFNEGYNSSSKSELIRRDLCAEALRLALMLTENSFTKQPKCLALIALMYLLASRFDARLDAQGEIVLLQDQDRTRWNEPLIEAGLEFLNAASTGNELSEYHLEAAIVAEHSTAPDFKSTNWANIRMLYDLLLQINLRPWCSSIEPSPSANLRVLRRRSRRPQPFRTLRIA